MKSYNNVLVFRIFLAYTAIFRIQGIFADGILYPRESESREVRSLDGIWHFRVDHHETGFVQKWFMSPLSQTGEVELMPVPSSFNDITQRKSVRDHLGWVWYSTTFRAPQRWKLNQRKVFLRFGSANYNSSIWINGKHLMSHEGGYLPFVGDVTDLLNYKGENVLVVAINNILTQSTIPQGTLYHPTDRKMYPEGYAYQTFNFDYFNFAGIHRPVYLYTTPPFYIDDITIKTSFEGSLGIVKYQVISKTHENSIEYASEPNCLVAIRNAEDHKVAYEEACHGSIHIPQVKLWWPYLSNPEGESPGYLYKMEVRVTSPDNPQDVDVYYLNFGVRTVKVENNSFYVNGEPFYFRGFGRHEDYSVRGRGVDPVMIVKDHNLLQWIGANSYRTSHYPYAEEILDVTDRLGIVVIDESPAIGLSGFDTKLMESHIQVMKELVNRDKNRASVLMWSIGNEPKSLQPKAPDYFQCVIDATRKFDRAHRPITIVMSSGFFNNTAPSLDVMSINRYFAWYRDSGRSQLIDLQMPNEVKSWYETYRKPVLVTEYGAGSVAGMHQSPSFLWTEDYQVNYLLEHFKAFDKLRYENAPFIGEMIWNFADFATPEESFRPWGCMKGVFTRDRQPKMAAHVVRERYWALANSSYSYSP